MTKEEIKKSDIKDLGLQVFELISKCIISDTETFVSLFNENIDYKEYKRLRKKEKKDIRRYCKEADIIIKSRPCVKHYIRFVTERILSSSNKIIVTPYPGIYIKEWIFESYIYIEDFADDLGISLTELLLILNGKARITEELAVKLSEVMGTSKEVWINLQKSYDLSLEGEIK